MNKNKKIILSGGGTGGSVTPLLQVYRELNKKFDFLFVGTYFGLEIEVVKKEGIAYRSIFSGKWRRYFSFKNFFDLFKIFLAFWQSLILLIQEKPDVVMSAGGFVAVPLSFAAWFLKIPVIVHQQDVVPGLANKLMSKVAKVVTVTFAHSLDFYGGKAKYVGNLGPDLNNFSFDSQEILDKYQIKNSTLPLILVLGGGTGSLFINRLVNESIINLLNFSRIVHISGFTNSLSSRDIKTKINNINYLKIDFIKHQDFLALISLSDLVVSRCGLATLTELSFLSKPAILIPMPDSHQEFNALEFSNKAAAIVLSEKELTADIFIAKIKNILSDDNWREELSKNIFQVIKNGNQEMITIIRRRYRLNFLLGG